MYFGFSSPNEHVALCAQMMEGGCWCTLFKTYNSSTSLLPHTRNNDAAFDNPAHEFFGDDVEALVEGLNACCGCIAAGMHGGRKFVRGQLLAPVFIDQFDEQTNMSLRHALIDLHLKITDLHGQADITPDTIIARTNGF